MITDPYTSLQGSIQGGSVGAQWWKFGKTACHLWKLPYL